MGDEYVTVRDDAGVVVVTVDREAKLNALSEAVLHALDDVFRRLGDADGARALVLRGAGSRAFVAGADIAEMARMTSEQGAAFARLGQRVMGRLEELPVPTIAFVDGVALGGGSELALACDFIAATESSSFGQPEVGLGLIPCFGGCVRLPERVGAARAKQLILAGDALSARQAFHIGLVSHVERTPDLLEEAVAELIRTLASRSPRALALAKRVLLERAAITRGDAFEREVEAFRRALEDDDSAAGMGAFLSRSPAPFPIVSD
jgi:enoyl-CoA hydratase